MPSERRNSAAWACLFSSRCTVTNVSPAAPPLSKPAPAPAINPPVARLMVTEVPMFATPPRRPGRDPAPAPTAELVAVAPGGELGTEGLADADQFEAFGVPGQADVLGGGADPRRAEEPFAGLDGLPALFEGREVPALTAAADHPEGRPFAGSRARRRPTGKGSTTSFEPRGFLQNMQVRYTAVGNARGQGSSTGSMFARCILRRQRAGAL